MSYFKFIVKMTPLLIIFKITCNTFIYLTIDQFKQHHDYDY